MQPPKFKKVYIDGSNLDGPAAKAACDVRKEIVLELKAALQSPGSDFQVNDRVLELGRLDQPLKQGKRPSWIL